MENTNQEMVKTGDENPVNRTSTKYEEARTSTDDVFVGIIPTEIRYADEDLRVEGAN